MKVWLRSCFLLMLRLLFSLYSLCWIQPVYLTHGFMGTNGGSLTKGRTYYVRFRTYKTVGKAKYYSAWSALNNVKISN